MDYLFNETTNVPLKLSNLKPGDYFEYSSGEGIYLVLEQCCYAGYIQEQTGDNDIVVVSLKCNELYAIAKIQQVNQVYMNTKPEFSRNKS